jgi:hypothetical protein
MVFEGILSSILSEGELLVLFWEVKSNEVGSKIGYEIFYFANPEELSIFWIKSLFGNKYSIGLFCLRFYIKLVFF